MYVVHLRYALLFLSTLKRPFGPRQRPGRITSPAPIAPPQRFFVWIRQGAEGVCLVRLCESI